MTCPRSIKASVFATLWLIAPFVAGAQTVALKTAGAAGTITANAGAVTLSDTGGMTSLLVQTVGTFSLTWEAQCAGDGTTFDADDEIPVTLVSSSPTAADSVATNVEGLYTATIAGCRAVRVIATAYTSGTMTVTLTATATGGSSGGGGGGSSAITSVVPGTGATNLGKAEDAVHTTGDTGEMPLAVRRDADTTLVDATGDYAPLQVNATGSLKVAITSGAGSGGTSLADNAGFTPATTSFTPVGGEVDDTGTTAATENSAGVVRMTVQRAMHVNLRNAAGTEITPATDVTEDAGETPGGTGPSVMSVRRNAAASSASTDGDNATFNTDGTGLLWTRNLDPCNGVAKTFIPISISTATTTEITPSLAGASTNYYVCSMVLVTQATNSVAIVDDDTDNCASVTSGMAGGTTAATGFVLAANGGLTFGDGLGAVFKTNGTNRVICIVTSAATQLSGVMSVVAAP